MLLAGDEVLRSQRGNNNGYCQDNELTWFNWALTGDNADMLRFVQQMIALRRRHPALMRRRFLSGEPSGERGLVDIRWFGADGEAPDWHNGDAQMLAFFLAATSPQEADLHATLNMSGDVATVLLPAVAGRRWHLAVATAEASPLALLPVEEQHADGAKRVIVAPRSVVVHEAF